MALKDWKQTIRGTNKENWEKLEFYSKRKGWDKIPVLLTIRYDDGPDNYQVMTLSEGTGWSGVLKIFKSKLQAMKFAREYMRKN